MRVNVQIDDKALLKAIAELGGRKGRAAINAATNQAITRVRVTTTREITKSYAIRSRDVNKTISVDRSTVSTLAATMRVKTVTIPLQEFGNPKKTRRGVQVTIRRGAGRKLYPRSFQATSNRGGRQVFWRTKDGNKLVPRGPIKLLLGPAVSQIAGSPTFLAKLRPVATQRFNEVLGQQFRRFGKQL